MRYTGLTLVKWGDFYTFSGLEKTPKYTLAGAPFLNLVASKTYEGKPWELFRENMVVYDFLKGIIVPMVSVTQIIKIGLSGNRYLANGLILPGSVTTDGKKIKSYSGYFSRDTLNFSYSEVESV